MKDKYGVTPNTPNPYKYYGTNPYQPKPVQSSTPGYVTVPGVGIINEKTGKVIRASDSGSSKNTNKSKNTNTSKNKNTGKRNNGGTGKSSNKGSGSSNNKSYVEQLLESLNKTPDFTDRAKEEKKAYDESVKAIIDGLEGSKTSIGNDMLSQGEQARQLVKQQQFNDYLRAQQGMSNRGLIGSGFNQGLNAQMAMAGGQRMSELANGVADRKAKVDLEYQKQIDKINAEKSGMTESKFKSQLEDAYREYAQKNFALQMQAAPYMQLTQGQIQDAKTAAANRASAAAIAQSQADRTAQMNGYKNSVDNMSDYVDLLGKQYQTYIANSIEPPADLVDAYNTAQRDYARLIGYGN